MPDGMIAIARDAHCFANENRNASIDVGQPLT
jgi:hypothetical protein